MTIFEMAGSCARRMAKSLIFVPLLVTSAVAIARADGLPPLDATDPVAQSLGFVPDLSKVTASATFKPGQHCGFCMQFQGKPSDATAGCSIFAGHSVPSRGWCSAFAQRS
jgi:hypothetical protein